MEQQFTLHPSVRAVIEPIITRMSTVVEMEKNAPMIGAPQNDPYKEDKLRCVHYVIRGGSVETTIERVADGRLFCKACGREIYAKFDHTAVDMLLDARKVIEMVMYFGMSCNLDGDAIRTLIDMKCIIPKVAQLCENLSTYVKREENAATQNATGIGKEYCLNGITSAF